MTDAFFSLFVYILRRHMDTGNSIRNTNTIGDEFRKTIDEGVEYLRSQYRISNEWLRKNFHLKQSSHVDDDGEGHMPHHQFDLLKALQTRELGARYCCCRCCCPDPVINPRSTSANDSFNWFQHYLASYRWRTMVRRLAPPPVNDPNHHHHCSLQEHSKMVLSVDFGTTGRYLCSSGADMKVAIWDWADANLRHIFHSAHQHSRIRQCKWSPDYSSIVTCADDGTVRLHHPIYESTSTYTSPSSTSSPPSPPPDCNTIYTHRTLCTHAGSASSVAWYDRTQLLSVGHDGAIYRIDLRDRSSAQSLLFTLKKNHRTIPLYTVDCNTARRPYQFVIGGQSMAIRVYDQRFIKTATESSNGQCYTLKPLDSTGDNDDAMPLSLNESYAVSCVQYCATPTIDSDRIVASYTNHELYVYDSSSSRDDEPDHRRHRRRYRHHRRRLYGHLSKPLHNQCCWFGEEFVFSTGTYGHIYAWHIDHRYPMFETKIDQYHLSNINDISAHPTEPVLATCGSNWDIKIWLPSKSIMTTNDDDDDEEEEEDADVDSADTDADMDAQLEKRIKHNLHVRQLNQYFMCCLVENVERTIYAAIGPLFDGVWWLARENLIDDDGGGGGGDGDGNDDDNNNNDDDETNDRHHHHPSECIQT